MTHKINEHGQPIGHDLLNWTGANAPTTEAISGQYCTLEALDVTAHAADLFQSFQADTEGALWTYMPVGPFKTTTEIHAWAESASASTDPLFFAVVSKETGRAIGFASFLRIDPALGVIEVGFIAFSPALQRTRMATEAMYLMMARAFNDWGYRRYEWKCDALNAPSQAAAKRFGFSYDGLFKQASVYKGRNRDTAWFSVLDGDWPARERAFKAWLSPDNFDANGVQKQKLSALMMG
jgi:RimJ/RimL family protein N-acetyltransferase